MATIQGWFKSTANPAQIVVRAPLLVLSLHFIPRFRSSARCQEGSSCFLCEREKPRQDLGILVVSQIGNQTASLLRLTSSQSQLIQAFQTMGARLQGTILDVEHLNGRILGARTMGRTVTELVPADNYCRAIGQKLYDRILRDHIKDLNSLFSTNDEVPTPNKRRSSG